EEEKGEPRGGPTIERGSKPGEPLARDGQRVRRCHRGPAPLGVSGSVVTAIVPLGPAPVYSSIAKRCGLPVRRKRLQHSADTFCQMFCGWRLANSYKDLGRLGSGTLSIDVLVGSCRFDGTPIEPLNIAGELHSWLCEDLTAQGITIGALLRAGLTARL